MKEGYIKFSLKHKIADAPKHPLFDKFNAARTKLYDMHLIGMNNAGIGFGNISVRAGDNFIISGTATGGKPILSPEDYCEVVGFDVEQNIVYCQGPLKASSETMSHGVIYRKLPAVNCVIHIHNLDLYHKMLDEGYPATPKEATYGTPEIAKEIEKLVTKNNDIFVMAGHEEGVISYGETIEKALSQIITLCENDR